MTIMQEALENPVFRMELMELLQKVIEEESRPKQLEKEKEDKAESDENEKDESE